MRILITVVACSVTLGGLFVGGYFDSPETAQLPQTETATPLAPSPVKSNPSTKTASALNSIKTLVAPLTGTPGPTPKVSASAAPFLPPLQRIDPTLSTTTSSGQVLAPTASPSSAPLQTPDPPPLVTPKATSVPTPTPTPSSSSPPQATPSQASESIYIVSAMPLIYKQRSDAQLQIQTYPQAQCSIKVTLPSGSVSGNNALVPQTADSSGFITWIWSINWNTKPSPPSGKIDLNCNKGLQNYSKNVEFIITGS